MKLHFESLQSEKTGYFGQAASTVSGDLYKNKNGLQYQLLPFFTLMVKMMILNHYEIFV